MIEYDFGKITNIVIWVSIIGLIAYDILPLLSKKKRDTISEKLRISSYVTSAAPLGWSLLYGHFFGIFKGHNGLISLLLIPVCALVLLLDYKIRQKIHLKPLYNVAYGFYMLVVGAIGYLLGSYFWSLA